MEKTPGTLEGLAIHLSRILQPLEDRLASGEIIPLFAELGVQFPPELEDQLDFITAAGNAASNVIQLPAIATALTNAIQNEEFDVILTRTTALIGALRETLNSIDQVADELNDLSSTFPQIDVAQFAARLPKRLFAYLIVNFLEENFPVSPEILEFWGIIERTEEQSNSGDPTKPPFTNNILHLRRVVDFLSSPPELLRTLYGWGNPDFDGVVLLQSLAKLIANAGAPAFFDPTSVPPILKVILAEVRPRTDLFPPGLSVVSKVEFEAESFAFGGFGFNMELGLGFPIAVGAELTIQPDGTFTLVPPQGPIEGELFLKVRGRPIDPTLPIFIFGQSEGTHLQASEINVDISTQLAFTLGEGARTGGFQFGASIKQGEFFVNPAGGDGFLSEILPSKGFKTQFDVEVGFSQEQGFYFNGSSVLEIKIPAHVDIGPVELQSITLSADFKNGEIPIGIGATLKASLGPMTIVIQDLGLKAIFSFPDDNNGNLGPIDLDIGFKAPSTLGLSIDGGGFKGGGFLDFEPEEARYSGVLELEFQDRFTLKAFGLLNTRLPNGQSGFSLLIVISSEFTPIQLGLGFKLNGVGGLLGLNRTVNIESLRAGLRANTLSSILFPTDIIANADRIISDLKQVFPPQADRFIFGPMAKITWGTPTLVAVDLGLVIEIPDPVRLFILGVLRAVLPNEKVAILQVQVNFLGEINFERRQLKFDASLFDSKLLGFNLSGDMAIRLDWGVDANFLLTVGGFHPAYEPPPMDLPTIRRLTLSLLSGDNPRLRLEMYFAVTSNTAQFGAKLELLASASKFNVYGFLSFDVLFQFNPFYFIAEITAMLALRVGSSSIASIKLTLTLEGPTPWKAQGTASFKICWFFTLKVRFNKTFGEMRNTTLPDLAVLPLLAEALRADDSWEGELPAQRHRLESIREASELMSELLLHPVGTLKISQKVVPLNVRIDRIGSQRPSDGREFLIVNAQPEVTTNRPQEVFAPAQFFDLTDEQKLTSASFKELDSGIRVGDAAQLHTGYAAAREVQYEVKYIDSQRDQRLSPGRGSNVFDVDAGAFNTWSLQGAIAQSAFSFARKRKSNLAPEAVVVSQEPFAIVNSSDLQLFDELSLLGSEHAAVARLNELVQTNPRLRGTLQVVPAFEMAA